MQWCTSDSDRKHQKVMDGNIPLEIFPGGIDSNTQFSSFFFIKQVVWSLEDSSRALLIQKYWLTMRQTTMTWKISWVLMWGFLNNYYLIRKVLRQWDSKFSPVLEPSRVCGRMPRYLPRRASREGRCGCPSCSVEEDIWNKVFGVVSLGFPICVELQR